MGASAGRRVRVTSARVGSVWVEPPASVRPMLATLDGPPLRSPELAYEPKYDGIRALAEVDGQLVRLRSRLGSDKTGQFADVAAALARIGTAVGRPMLLDGEIVALDTIGEPTSFLELQPRMHTKRPPAVPVAFVAFDLLRDGGEDVRPLPLVERRRRLEAVLQRRTGSLVRLGAQVVGNGETLWRRVRGSRWDGLIVKQLASSYASGRRSTAWRKRKLVHTQTCVVGGWTVPRGTRVRFGALLLGVHDPPGTLCYVGNVGSGFSEAELDRISTALTAIRATHSPFAAGPAPPAAARWVQPTLAVEVKFTEWTRAGRLRHPTYLGLRNDVDVSRVGPEAGGERRRALSRGRRLAARPAHRPREVPEADGPLLDQLEAIEEGRGSGTLLLPDGTRLRISNLDKVFWPEGSITKGDLFRHYVRVAPMLLPVLADRPLVMRRHPHGIKGKAFYQHRAPETAPAGVRVETPAADTDPRPHLIGGSLATLLYSTQLAAISQDTWLSRVGTEMHPDHVVLDLDPPDGLSFARVRDLARWIRDELDGLGVTGYPKTSGVSGLHIYIPMPPGVPYESGQLFCQIIATVVTRRHPRAATIERAVSARGRRIYVDYLQNKLGRTLASAYSARASTFAGVSTPLTWAEVDAKVSPRDFTVHTFGARLASAGDLWATLREAKPADPRAVLKYAHQDT